MRKYQLFLSAFFLVAAIGYAQELKCSISINADQLSGTNKQVFSTLEKALTDFVNNKQWTSKVFKTQERIECGMTLIINSQNNGNFTGTLQVNAVRPVYGSSYKSPIFNYKDNAIAFEYVEYEPLIYNPNAYESNLVSLITYYIYMILAIDSDTFALQGGEPFYQQALNIANLAQQGNYEGWEAKRNSLNRFTLVDQILSTAHKEYRQIMYAYHRDGFDRFAEDEKKAKNAVLENILLFNNLYGRSRNSYLFRFFFDAKADEIVEVFKEGPTVNTADLKRLLRRVSAPNNAKWEKIK